MVTWAALPCTSMRTVPRSARPVAINCGSSVRDSALGRSMERIRWGPVCGWDITWLMNRRWLISRPSLSACIRSPSAVGLSHMGEGGEKEGVVPPGLKHFVADAGRTWRCLQDIDGQLADDGEIFRGVILAAAAGILVE